MTDVVLDIGNALEARLEALTPKVTAYENATFDPSEKLTDEDMFYQRAYLLPAASRSPTLGGTTELVEEKGIFQVSIYYRPDEGTAGARARAEAIRAHFPRGLTLTSGGVSVQIQQRASVGPAMSSDGWYVVPVSIPYFCYVFA